MDAKELINAAAAETKRLPDDWGVTAHFDIATLTYTIGALQLALRHPKFGKERGAMVVRHVIAHLIAGVPEDMPATRELLRLGGNPKYDQ